MAKQNLILGVMPTGIGGDDSRTGSEKINSNFDEVYTALGAPTSGHNKDVIPAALPVNKGGTGGESAEVARANLNVPAISEIRKRFGEVPPIRAPTGYDYNNIQAGDYLFCDNETVGYVNKPPFDYCTVTCEASLYGNGQLLVTARDYFTGEIAVRAKQNNNWSLWQYIPTASNVRLTYGRHSTTIIQNWGNLNDIQPGDYLFCDMDVGPNISNRPPFGYCTVTCERATADNSNTHLTVMAKDIFSGKIAVRSRALNNWSAWQELAFLSETRNTKNTWVDGNGFIKAASPIIQLFSNKIEMNDEAQQQNIEFKKLGVGDYLIKNSSGFAQEGWYIEQPKDANGNVLVAVVYEQLENNDISIKTYKKKFDLEISSIVADLDKPTDIPDARWIDIRLQELPQPDIEFESIAPPDFQPTNLSEAVQSFMDGGGYVSE